jgi:hypothetical protein
MDPWEEFAGGAPAATQEPEPWKDFESVGSPVKKAPGVRDILSNAGEAAIETAKGFIPRSIGDVAKILTPVAAVPEEVGKTYHTLSDILFGGKTTEEALRANRPEAFALADAEKTPPFSKERFKAGFDVLAEMGTAAGITSSLQPKPSLTETLFPKPAEVKPITPDVPLATPESIAAAPEPPLAGPVATEVVKTPETVPTEQPKGGAITDVQKETTPQAGGQGSEGQVAPVSPEQPAVPITEAVPQTGALYDQIKGAIASRVQQVRDAVGTQSIPKSIRAGIGDEVIQHAAARTYVPHLVDDMLAKVFPDEYKNPEAMSKTIDIINKDNVLGGYDAARQELEALRQQVDKGEGGETAKKQLQAQEEAVKNIEDRHDLAAYDKEVAAAKNDPQIAGNIGRWEKTVVPAMDELYNELKGVDPNLPRDSRGRHFEARINLLTKQSAAEMADWSNPDKPMPQGVSSGASSYRNPNVKQDKFARQAKLTGDYSTDPELALLNSFGPRWNEATKLRLYNAIVEKGVGKIAEHGEAIPDGSSRLAVKMPETDTETGRTRMVEKNLFVPKNLVEELRTALGTDLRVRQNPVAKALTQVQLLQLADATAHTKNIHSVIINSLGHDAAWKDVASKVPFVSSASAVGEIFKVGREIAADTPAIRSEIATMAKRGMIRPDYPATGVQKITRMQGFIHDVDTASRVIMNRRWDELVKRGIAPDSEIARRNFVQSIGEYNRRLMGRYEQFYRDMGMSPFIVAGRTFNRFSKRLLTGDPGFEATSTKAALGARAAQLSTLAFASTLPAIVNMFTTGTMLGREGTPIGAIDMGPRFDGEDGKRRVIDVFQLTGIRRGLRSVGLNAAIEGIKNGKTLNEIAGDASNDVITTAAHPWIGPAPGAVVQGVTGHRLDLRSGWQTTQARNMGGGFSQLMENARVALKQQNPLIYSLLSAPGILSKDEGQSAGGAVGSAAIKTPLSAIGYKEVDTPAVQKMRELNRAKAPVGGYSPEQIEKHKAKGEVTDFRPAMFKRLSKDERDEVLKLATSEEAALFRNAVEGSGRRR